MQKQLIEANGIHLACQEDGNGKDMILIHGKGYSKENMNILFDHYKNHYHVISYDVRGHGESDKPEHFTLEDDVKDLFSLIQVMHLQEPLVIGFSMGSYIALKTAEEYPDLFSKMVLIGTKGGGSSSSTQRIEDQAVSSGKSREQIRKEMMHRVFAPQTTSEEIQTFDRSIAGPVRLTAEQQKAITESLQNFNLMQKIKQVRIPVLVLTGEYDGINPPKEGKKVAEALPEGKFEVIPDAGHIAFFENQKRVFSLTDDFFNEQE